MRKGTLFVIAMGALLLTGFVSEALADKGDRRVQFGILENSPTDDLGISGQTTELDSSVGYHASFEYMVTELIGVEPAATSAKSDVMVKETGFPDLNLGEVDFLAVTTNLNFHLLRDKKTDLFVGPTVGYMFWGDLDSPTFQQTFTADDELIYGLNVGVVVPVGESGWGFSGAVDYLIAELPLEGSSQDVGVNPVQVKIGASYKF